VKVVGPEHPDTLTTLNNLALAYWNAGKTPEALALFEQVRDVRVKKLGPDHPHTLTTLDNLAGAYRSAGKTPEAIALYEQVRAARLKSLGPDHLETLTALSNLAVAYWSVRQLDKSVPLFEEVLKGRQARLGRDHLDTQLAVANLGVNYKDAGRLAEAVPLLEEAHRAGRKHPRLRWVGTPLLEAYALAGKAPEAVGLAQEQLAEARAALPKDSPQLAGVLAQVGDWLLKARAWNDAEPILRECLALREKIQPEVWTTFNAKSMLGGALFGQKKYADAEPLLRAGYEGMKQRAPMIPPQGKQRLPEACRRLVELYEATENKEEAARWRQELEELLKANKKEEPKKEP
jgi:tetratricopeptide (TPR) repeat protein